MPKKDPIAPVTAAATQTVVMKARPPAMIRISGGEFIMGISDAQIQQLVAKEDWAKEWYDRDLFQAEQPQHRLRTPAYEIARFPVTNAEYHRFVWNTGYRVPRGWVGFYYPDGKADHPVVGISQIDALLYCQWLAQETGIQYRLPTEAEWERAARGPDTRLYPWGEEFDPWRCNTSESGKRGTTATGEYSPGGDSFWGCADMSGNVWEWTCSLLQPYPYPAGPDPETPQEKGMHVIRGGAWYYSHKLARVTARESAQPTYVSPALGFRLAHTP